MLKNFIKGIKEALPTIGGVIGYSVAGPLGAGIGSGIGSLAAGKDVDDSFRNALIGGSLGYAGQTYFGRNPDSNFLGIGNFFREGTIPGVSNVVKPFGQRGAESSFAKMASLTAPKAKVGAAQMSLDEYVKGEVAKAGTTDPAILEYVKEKAVGDYYSQANKFDVSDFFMNNAGYIVPGILTAAAAGGFDEEDINLPTAPEAGSQGQLQTGVANLVNPILNPDGSYTYPVKDGGIMQAKNGSIASFQENSPRRDLFLEREGPISDDRGSPNKDTVYAKLADGEFVVNADTVADIGYGMGATSLDQAKEMGGSFFYGLQDAQKQGILGNMVGRA